MLCIDDPSKPNGAWKSADNGIVKHKGNEEDEQGQTAVRSSLYLPCEGDTNKNRDYSAADLTAAAVTIYELLVFGLPPEPYSKPTRRSIYWFEPIKCPSGSSKKSREALVEWNKRKMIFQSNVGKKVKLVLSSVLLELEKDQRMTVVDFIKDLKDILESI
jgi:hypothetical protein